MKGITGKQASVLGYICARINEIGIPPTRSEIARAFGFASLNAAEQHLRALQAKKYVKLVPASSRGIVVLLKPDGKPFVRESVVKEWVTA